MKLASFRVDRRDSYGVVMDDGIVDVDSRLGDSYPDLRAVLAANAIDKVRDAADGQATDFNVDAVTMLPPVTNPEMIICIGANYKSFVEDVGETPPTEPTYIFRRAAAPTCSGCAAAPVRRTSRWIFGSCRRVRRPPSDPEYRRRSRSGYGGSARSPCLRCRQ